MPILPADDALLALVAFVCSEAQPLRIVLFGSRSTGTARPDSDYDLLVVVDNDCSPREVTRRLYMHKRGLGVSADFVVATAAQLARHADAPGLVYRVALTTGRSVYVRDTQADHVDA